MHLYFLCFPNKTTRKVSIALSIARTLRNHLYRRLEVRIPLRIECEKFTLVFVGTKTKQLRQKIRRKGRKQNRKLTVSNDMQHFLVRQKVEAGEATSPTIEVTQEALLTSIEHRTDSLQQAGHFCVKKR